LVLLPAVHSDVIRYFAEFADFDHGRHIRQSAGEKRQAKLKEISSLIYENWYWVDQEKVFEKTKYIIMTQIEQA